MSENTEQAGLDNGNEAPVHDHLEDELMEAIARADEASGETEAPSLVRHLVACKVANIVNGMEGVKRKTNGRYPSHSIDQVVSAVSPLISAAGLRIKTEVLSIEHFVVLPNMPFWRETNGKFEQYTRDVHLFKMELRFIIIDGTSGDHDAHDWTHVFEIGRSEQDQSCGSAVSYATKDFLKRQFMIADDSDDPDFKNSGDGQQIDTQALDGELVPIVTIEPNAKKRSDKSPGWFAKDESGQISVAMWETSFKAIDVLMAWNNDTMLKLLRDNDNRYRFDKPLMLRVSANQYGLNLARENQLNTLENPAIAEQFMYTADKIIPGISAEQAAEYLEVEQFSDFNGPISDALQVISMAKRFAASSGGDSSQPPPATDQRPPNMDSSASSGASRQGSRETSGRGVDPALTHGPQVDEYGDF